MFLFVTHFDFNFGRSLILQTIPEDAVVLMFAPLDIICISLWYFTYLTQILGFASEKTTRLHETTRSIFD